MITNNPYYNEQLSKNGWYNFAQGAQNITRSVGTNPKVWAANPIVGAGALATSFVMDPVKDTIQNNEIFKQVEGAGTPMEQFDDFGNQIYNTQQHQEGLDDLQEQYNDYWYNVDSDEDLRDASPQEAFNKIREGSNLVTGLRNMFGRKKRRRQQRTLDNKIDDLRDYEQNITQNNLRNTQNQYSRFARNAERQRRMNNLNKLNVY